MIMKNKHSYYTATLMALLSRYCSFSILFPNKLSIKSAIFPKIKSIQFSNGDSIEVSKIIKKRVIKLIEYKYSIGRDFLKRSSDVRYELSHLLEDVLSLIGNFSVYGYGEEYFGLIGNGCIYFNDIVLIHKDIMKFGKMVLEYVYNDRRIKNKTNRYIKMNELTRFLFN